MTEQWWCLCGRLMEPVFYADGGMVLVAWYCRHCGRWEWVGT